MDDRRQAPRAGCVLPVRLYPHGEAKVIETLTKDLSVGGLRVLSPIPRPLATRFSIEFALGAGEEPLSLAGQLMWFQVLPYSEQYYFGFAFEDVSENTSIRLSRFIERISSSSIPAKIS